MKLIPLSKNCKYEGLYSAQVDDEDYEWLVKYNWRAIPNKRGVVYAIAKHNGKTTQMHRLIMGVTDRLHIIDHKDGNGLNNQRQNLRACTVSQNARNRTKRKSASCHYLGVSKVVSKTLLGETVRYVALITANYKTKNLGTFRTAEDAAMAYDKAARELHGEFANPNFK